MNQDKLKQLRIASETRERPHRSVWGIFLGVAVITGVAVFFAWPRLSDSTRVVSGDGKTKTGDEGSNLKTATSAMIASTNSSASAAKPAAGVKSSVLTVSGYIVNRERIELSPRFMGVVKWIGVKKGDSVTNGQVVVLLDDSEYKARLAENEGRLANAAVNIQKAELDFKRAKDLVEKRVETQKLLDDSELVLRGARASFREIEGQVQLIKTYIDWTIIRSPINGVVLEKLVDPNELVTPQSFGGTRGPSTALISVADLNDLQVEIDLGEQDLPKVHLGQKCKISPDAYPDRQYDGFTAEIAPEANRQKGKLQIKVQIEKPDHFLTPELSAKVDFLEEPKVK